MGAEMKVGAAYEKAAAELKALNIPLPPYAAKGGRLCTCRSCASSLAEAEMRLWRVRDAFQFGRKREGRSEGETDGC